MHSWQLGADALPGREPSKKQRRKRNALCERWPMPGREPGERLKLKKNALDDWLPLHAARDGPGVKQKWKKSTLDDWLWKKSAISDMLSMLPGREPGERKKIMISVYVVGG